MNVLFFELHKKIYTNVHFITSRPSLLCRQRHHYSVGRCIGKTLHAHRVSLWRLHSYPVDEMCRPAVSSKHQHRSLSLSEGCVCTVCPCHGLGVGRGWCGQGPVVAISAPCVQAHAIAPVHGVREHVEISPWVQKHKGVFLCLLGHLWPGGVGYTSVRPGPVRGPGHANHLLALATILAPAVHQQHRPE